MRSRRRKEWRIRRIRKVDCEQKFRTGHEKFDQLGLDGLLRRDESGLFDCYVLLVNGEVVGVLCIQRWEMALYVSRLGVKEGHTGRGYGARLMQFTLEKAVKGGRKRIAIKAHEHVWGFFEKLGFKKVKEYSDSGWDGLCAVMELELDY